MFCNLIGSQNADTVKRRRNICGKEQNKMNFLKSKGYVFSASGEFLRISKYKRQVYFINHGEPVSRKHVLVS